MVQFLSIIFFLGFLQFLLGFSKVPVFLCRPVLYTCLEITVDGSNVSDRILVIKANEMHNFSDLFDKVL